MPNDSANQIADTLYVGLENLAEQIKIQTDAIFQMTVVLNRICVLLQRRTTEAAPKAKTQP